MSSINTYNNILKLKKRVDLVKSLYNNLKGDKTSMTPSQVNSQIRKITNRLAQIDIEQLGKDVESLKPFLYYEYIKTIADEIKQTIKQIKDYTYSIQQEKDEQYDDEDLNLPENKTVNLIKDKYAFLTKMINSGETETPNIIKDAKRLENIISRLNFENLPEGVYEEMLNIKNEVAGMVKTMLGIEKTEKYGPYLWKPLIDLIASTYTLGNMKRAKAKAMPIIDFIEDPNNILMLEPPIKRIIANKMTPKEFKTFYNSVVTMIQSKRKFESFNDYKNNYEKFYII